MGPSHRWERRSASGFDDSNATEREQAVCAWRTWCAPEAFAGVERYVQETAIAMAQAGCSVTVVGGGDQTMRQRLEQNGVRWLPGGSPGQALRSLRPLDRVDVIDTHMTQADLVGAVFAALGEFPSSALATSRLTGGAAFPRVQHSARYRGASPIR